MNVEKAIELIATIADKNNYVSQEKTFKIGNVVETQNPLVIGACILAMYQPNFEFDFQHDVLYAADFEETVEKMSEQEITTMAEVGWGYDEELNSWYLFS